MLSSSYYIYSSALAAKNNISIVAVQDTYSKYVKSSSSSGGLFGGGKSESFSENRVANVGSSISAGSNLTIQAGTRIDGVTLDTGSIGVLGSNVAAGGDLNLSATGDVIVASGQNAHSLSISKSSSGLFSSTAKAYGEADITQAASNLSGKNVTVDAGRNVLLVASNVLADENATLIARSGDVKVLNAENLHAS